MKSFKFLFFVLALCLATSTNAQFSRGGGFSEDGHFTLDVKFGGVAGAGGFGVGFGYQQNIKEFNGWNLAWDVVSVDYAAPFNSPADFDLLAVRTGLRLFTPTFWNDNFRVYTNLAPGYSCGIWREGNIGAWYDPTTGAVIVVDDSMKAHHGFGLSFGAGIQFKEKFSLGYTLQYETAGKTKCHFATIGITF